MATNITIVQQSDLDEAIEKIGLKVKTDYLKKSDASTTYATKTELTNAASDSVLESKVATIMSGYNFSVDSNGNLILTTP